MLKQTSEMPEQAQ